MADSFGVQGVSKRCYFGVFGVISVFQHGQTRLSGTGLRPFVLILLKHTEIHRNVTVFGITDTLKPRLEHRSGKTVRNTRKHVKTRLLAWPIVDGFGR